MARKRSLSKVIFCYLEINSTTILKSNFLLSANLQGATPWAHNQCKSLVERCSDNPNSKTAVFSWDFGPRGTKTAVFFRDFGLLWNQSCCIFSGFRCPRRSKTAEFSWDFGLLWNQNCCVFQRFWYTGARPGRTCVRNFYFNSSLQNKSA